MSGKKKSPSKSASKGKKSSNKAPRSKASVSKSKRSRKNNSKKYYSKPKKVQAVASNAPKQSTSQDLMKNDFRIPDAQFYQVLVILMILFNLLGLGILIYNQYEGQLLESPPTLTQIGGEARYDKCMSYCEKYKTEEDGAEGLRNEYTNNLKGFTVSTDESFDVENNDEINAIEFTAPGTQCDTKVRMSFVDPRGMELDNWVITNYPDYEKQLMNEPVLDTVAYKVFTRSATESDKVFVELGAEIVEVSYEYAKGTTCLYSNDDVYAQDFISNLELVAE